jgi:hypothetical protein
LHDEIGVVAVFKIVHQLFKITHARQLIDFKIPTYSVGVTGKKPEKMFFTRGF